MTINLGIIGNGQHFKKNIKPVLTQLNFLKKKNILTKKNNIEFFKKRFDIIYISNQTKFHGKTIIKCLEMNFNVMCEKPIVINKLDLKKINALAKKKKLLIFECYMYKYHEVFKYIKKKIKNKKILKVCASFTFPSLKLNNFRYKEEQGGFFWDSAVYPISLDTFLFRKKKVQIKLNTYIQNNTTINGNVIQKSKNFQKIYFWGTNKKYENKIEIICKDCTIFVNNFFSKKNNIPINLNFFSLRRNKNLIFYGNHFKKMFLYVFKNYKKEKFRINALKEINDNFNNCYKIYKLVQRRMKMQT
jgi:predicted dehydrogenase